MDPLSLNELDGNDLKHILDTAGQPIVAVPCPVVDGRINPHVTRFYMEDGKITDVFHVKPIYYETLDGKWRPLSEVTDGFGNTWMNLIPDWDKKMSIRYLIWLLRRMDMIGGHINIPTFEGYRPVTQRNFHFTTTDFFPVPGVTVDGYTFYNPATGDTFTNTRNHAGNGHNDSAGSTTGQLIRNYTVSNTIEYMFRCIFLFDTSAITSTPTISAATFSIKAASHSSTLGGSSEIAIPNPASNTSLADSDYNIASWTMTAQASGVNFASWDDTNYNVFTMNGTGLGNISKTGISKFGTVTSFDINNSAPTWSSGTDSYVDALKYSDTGGTSSDPKLTVTYATASGPANVKTWDAVTQSTGVKTYEGVALASTKSVIGVT